jgi:hypothetical protein
LYTRSNLNFFVFSVIMRREVVWNRRFWTICRSYHQGSGCPRRNNLLVRSLALFWTRTTIDFPALAGQCLRNPSAESKRSIRATFERAVLGDTLFHDRPSWVILLSLPLLSLHQYFLSLSL